MARSTSFSKYSVSFFPLLLSALIFENASSLPLRNNHNVINTADSLTDFQMSATIPVASPSQGTSDVERKSVHWYSMITKLPGDWYGFGKQTFRVQSLSTVAELGAVTAAFAVFDHASYTQTRNFLNSTAFLQHASNYLVSAGDGRYHLAVIGGFAVIGWAANSDRMLRTSSQLVETFLASGFVVQVLKHSTGRQSPSVVMRDDDGDWRLFPNQKQYQLHQSQYYSFPSGHLATLVGSLTVLNENYPEYHVWLTPASYLLTGLVGASLVGKGMHWYSDLPLGIALGYSFGKIASNSGGININRSLGEYSPQINFAPSFTLLGGGVNMNIAW
jgi:membrane-associated phospholipid phosphatase